VKKSKTGQIRDLAKGYKMYPQVFAFASKREVFLAPTRHRRRGGLFLGF
jgi:hypothetical protein